MGCLTRGLARRIGCKAQNKAARPLRQRRPAPMGRRFLRGLPRSIGFAGFAGIKR